MTGRDRSNDPFWQRMREQLEAARCQALRRNVPSAPEPGRGFVAIDRNRPEDFDELTIEQVCYEWAREEGVSTEVIAGRVARAYSHITERLEPMLNDFLVAFCPGLETSETQSVEAAYAACQNQLRARLECFDEQGHLGWLARPRFAGVSISLEQAAEHLDEVSRSIRAWDDPVVGRTSCGAEGLLPLSNLLIQRRDFAALLCLLDIPRETPLACPGFWPGLLDHAVPAEKTRLDTARDPKTFADLAVPTRDKRTGWHRYVIWLHRGVLDRELTEIPTLKQWVKDLAEAHERTKDRPRNGASGDALFFGYKAVRFNDRGNLEDWFMKFMLNGASKFEVVSSKRARNLRSRFAQPR